MTRMAEIQDVADTPVFYINWHDLSIIEETLSPSDSGDWLWYSQKSDCFLNESELYFTEEDAISSLNGYLSNF